MERDEIRLQALALYVKAVTGEESPAGALEADLQTVAEEYPKLAETAHKLLKNQKESLAPAVLTFPTAFGPLVYNTEIKQVASPLKPDDQTIYLTTRQGDVLALLMRNPQRVLSSQAIFQAVWDYNSESDHKSSVKICISRLRNKIGETREKRIIRTLRGSGYTLNPALDKLPARGQPGTPLEGELSRHVLFTIPL